VKIFFYYLGVSNSKVSVVLVKEDERIQCPIYYSSQTLDDVGTKYLKVKKATFTLVSTSQKLKPSF
jgi:hypothetical protein